MTAIDLPAGPELDVLVAEKVLGQVPCDKWTVQRYTELGPIWVGGVGCGHEACYPPGNPAKHSTNISAAWEVAAVFDTFMVRRWYDLELGFYFTAIVTRFSPERFGKSGPCPDAPLAICHAALRAVGETK
jgi:hypothetical protein